MKSQSTKVFTFQGKHVSFDTRAFRDAFNIYCKIAGTSKADAEEDLGAHLHTTASAIHNWRFGNNGPGDLELIRMAGEFLGCGDWRLLFKEVEEDKSVSKLTDRQLDAAKRIYDILVWFLTVYSDTDGFSNWLDDFESGNVGISEDKIFERITKMKERVSLVINQEYFDLHDHPIYDELCEIAADDMDSIHMNFTSEGTVQDGLALVWSSYETVMQKLNNVIERYMR